MSSLWDVFLALVVVVALCMHRCPQPEAGKVTLADQEGRNTLQLVIQQPEVPHDDEDQPAPKDTTLTVGW